MIHTIKKKYVITRNSYACIIFTLVCAFRSFVPRVDAERLCFWDFGKFELISSPFVGRCFATIAEIVFSYQITDYWLSISNLLITSTWISSTSKTSWYLCCFAQLLCWCGVITTNNIYHAFENSLWGIAALLLSISSAKILLYNNTECNSTKCILMYYLASCLVFAMYIFIIDVPMYYTKWLNNVGGGIDLTFYDGFYDSLTCNVDKSFDLWMKEIPWMTGYFILGPVISIQLEKHTYSKKLY